MDKFVIRSKRPPIPSGGSSNNPDESHNRDGNIGESSEKRVRMETLELCEDDIISDPALRKAINDYDPRIRDEVRRKYVLKGPCQPLLYDFPRT